MRQDIHTAGIRQDIHNSDIPVLCRACEARHKGICGALEPHELVQLARRAGKKSAEPGTELVASDRDQESYANILSGVVRITKLMADGRQQIVGLQFAPDFLGRPLGDRSQVSAEAADRVDLCTFPRAAFEDLLRQRPALEHRLYQQALRELDEARDWLMTLGRKSAAERVASFILLLGRNLDPLKEGYSDSFDIPLKRADIADFLGLTIETVSRHITRLKKSGAIKIEKNRHVTVLDYPALETASGD